MQDLPQNIDCIEGTKNGPCVVVMGAIHGNERLGEAVIRNLSREVKPENLHGKLILILGNPVAYAANRRFIDCDLNRLFSSSQMDILTKKPANTLNIEEKRALEIEPYLQAADYLLDIHCTIKKSVPFVYCEKTKAHLKLAKLFNTEYIVSAASQCRIPDLISCGDNYVDWNGGVGITYEAGWHKRSAVLSEVMAQTYRFLQTVGSLEPAFPAAKTAKSPTQVVIYDYIIPQTTHFHFKKDFANFDVVEKGEVIAQDEGKVFKAGRTSFIIFPKVEIVPGTPACYLSN